MGIRKIFYILLSLILVVSCNNDSRQDWSGMEHFEFEISGMVTDNLGKPIYGISVSASGSTTQTSADGTYKLEGQGGTATSLIVSFADVDGASNGGLYFGATMNVQLEYVEGKHGPFLGLFSKSGVNVSLTSLLAPTPDFNTAVQ